MKLPVISLAILGGQIALAASTGNAFRAMNGFQSFYTGIDFETRSFVPQNLLIGYGPWIVKRFVGAIARPRMPVKGLPISLS